MADWPPPFQFAHPDHDRLARIVAAHVALGGWCNALAWDAQFHERFRLDRAEMLRRNRKRRLRGMLLTEHDPDPS